MKIYIILLLLVVSVIATAGLASSYEQGIPADTAALRTVDKTYHIQLTDTAEERYVNYNKRVWFEFGTNEHYVTFVASTAETVEYHMTWEANTIIMDLGETAEFDIDGDGTNDIKIWVKDIFLETSTADFSSADGGADSEPVPVMDLEPEPEEDPNIINVPDANDVLDTTDADENDNNSITEDDIVNAETTDLKSGMAWWVWVLIGLAVLGIVVYFLNKSKK